MSLLLAFDCKPMSLPLSIKRVSFGFILVASCSFGLAQGFESQGNEFQIVPSLQGDQVNVSAAVNASGGLVVWEDSFTDGDGLGISGRRLDSSLSGVFSTFRVNVDGVGNQRKPDVALLGYGNGPRW